MTPVRNGQEPSAQPSNKPVKIGTPEGGYSLVCLHAIQGWRLARLLYGDGFPDFEDQLVDMLPDEGLETAERVLAELSVLSRSNPAADVLAKARRTMNRSRLATQRRLRKGTATSSAGSPSPLPSFVLTLNRDRPYSHRAARNMKDLPPKNRKPLLNAVDHLENDWRKLSLNLSKSALHSSSLLNAQVALAIIFPSAFWIAQNQPPSRVLRGTCPGGRITSSNLLIVSPLFFL